VRLLRAGGQEEAEAEEREGAHGRSIIANPGLKSWAGNPCPCGTADRRSRQPGGSAGRRIPALTNVEIHRIFDEEEIAGGRRD
jgi:hypothetical protein